MRIKVSFIGGDHQPVAYKAHQTKFTKNILSQSPQIKDKNPISEDYFRTSKTGINLQIFDSLSEKEIYTVKKAIFDDIGVASYIYWTAPTGFKASPENSISTISPIGTEGPILNPKRLILDLPSNPIITNFCP